MSNQELGKAYDPSQVEDRWYRFWTEQGYFHADPAARKAPFTIVCPPPNVTGSLHMGHALTFTIQDILIRWKRMQAYNAMWLPGVDHAGIATQLVVERQLKRTENKTRHDLGREEFLRRVWAWKAESGSRITEQLRKLGCSLDWKRERFTMDDGLSAAVREAFVRMYEDGLIYRARRLINWCSRCFTALSDLEVEHKDEAGSLWHIAYPVLGSDDKLTVATTRPETMLGDTAIAVHPEDERFKHLIGKRAVVPLTGRDVPIIGDAELVSKEFGTGAVKVTPGHDPNDFEVGVRHSLEQLSIFDTAGRLIAPAPVKYVGLTVADARKAVLADLEAEAALVKTEPHALALGRCGRCDTVVEPMLSLQWFVKTKPLAAPAIAAVEEGKTRFVPESWTKVYMHWMTNIRDWCISRQLWWGHRIPAWHCAGCAAITVAREAPAACGKCGGAVTQDEDVLDTWFSSGLWPFSTLGWPEQTKDLKNFYPNSVMETGHDILFFWVARMMMMGLYFMKKPPFHTVYLHAMVVDEDGEKMSKVKGNVIDPLDVIGGASLESMLAAAEKAGAPKQALSNIKKTYPDGIPAAGADSLRFALAVQAAQGRNIRLSLQRIESFRHFANKVWNASRFALMYLKGFDPDRFADALREEPKSLGLGLAERWILSRLTRVSKEVDDALEDFRVNEAAQQLYRFIWNELCDWYIELAKPALHVEGPASSLTDEVARRKRMAQGTLTTCLETALRLLHPFMPYLSEEIWQKLPKPLGTPNSIMVTLYPIPDAQLIDDEAETVMGLVQEVVGAVRTLRAEYGVPLAARPRVVVFATGARLEVLTAQLALVQGLARAEVELAQGPGTAPEKSVQAVVQGDVEVYLPLGGLIDVAAEAARLDKELAKARADVAFSERKLGNASFVDRAPAEIVDKERAAMAEAKAREEKLAAALARLK
ncbi:MAG: valine--tRNA ligase [Deltaproteobacteria bacterium]|nr:valine--tRNA ligase [Deltaproteobacteria bacterium]